MSPLMLYRSSWKDESTSFDVKGLGKLLDHDNHEMRDDFRKFVSDPIMTPKYNISLKEERDLALVRLQRICDVGI